MPQNDNNKPTVISLSRSPNGARATAAEKSLIRLRFLDYVRYAHFTRNDNIKLLRCLRFANASDFVNAT